MERERGAHDIAHKIATREDMNIIKVSEPNKSHVRFQIDH